MLHSDCWRLKVVEVFPQHGLRADVLMGRAGMLQDRVEAARLFTGS